MQWDISAPPFGDRVVLDNFQKHSYPIGIVVNMEGERFVDEGADFRNHTYAKYGREVMKQPQRAAVQIFDARPSAWCATSTASAGHQGRGQHASRSWPRRSTSMSRACARPSRPSTPPASPAISIPPILDGKGTEGITPPKSNWALPINEPPYSGFVVTCGITFTFGGLRINTDGEVLDSTDTTIPGLYAAGELVGGLFYQNYPGGAGLMSGAVFGRLAGQSAGRHAMQPQRAAAE